MCETGTGPRLAVRVWLPQRLHVEMPVPAEIKKNRPLLSFFLGAQGFAYRPCDGVVGFRRRNDAFRTGKLNPRGEGVELLYRAGFNQSQIQDVRYERSHAMVTQPARMNSRRNERAPQRVHFDERRQMSGISNPRRTTSSVET